MIGILAGLLCALSWATGSIMIKDLSRKLDPFTLNAPRALVGGLAMLVLTLATGRAGGYAGVDGRKLFFMIISMAVGGGLGDSLYVLAISRIGVSRAFPIASTYPALTLLLSFLILGEPIGTTTIAGLALVTVGVIFVGRMSEEQRNATSRRDLIQGVLFSLAAALLWSVSMILVAPGIEGLDPVLVASIRVPALSIGLGIVVLARRTAHKYRTLSKRDWWLVVAGGLIGWGLGSMLFVVTVGLIGPGRAAIITSVSPLFALPLSVLFLREHVSPTVLVGTALAVCGIALVS